MRTLLTEWQTPPPGLIETARFDMEQPSLWSRTASGHRARATVRSIVSQFGQEEQITGNQIVALKRILSKNNIRRAKLEGAPHAVPAPTAEEAATVAETDPETHEEGTMPTPYDPLIGLGDLQVSLGLSAAKVHALLEAGTLPPPTEGLNKSGASWRWPNSLIERWKADHAAELLRLQTTHRVAEARTLTLEARVEALEARVTVLEGKPPA